MARSTHHLCDGRPAPSSRFVGAPHQRHAGDVATSARTRTSPGRSTAGRSCQDRQRLVLSGTGAGRAGAPAQRLVAVLATAEVGCAGWRTGVLGLCRVCAVRPYRRTGALTQRHAGICWRTVRTGALRV
jgi:hypothetical protein